VRIVGSEEACKKFIQDAGLREQRLQETNVLSFSVGILIGIFVGVFIINLPGKLPFKLGVAGGPLLAALIIGHYGRIGRLSFRTPVGAINVLRELGLAFFLAGAGLHAGQKLLAVLSENGMELFVVGAVMTIFPMLISVVMARFVFKFNTLTTMGLISGAMTSTPALGAITNVTDSDLPSLTYATVYPVAVVAMTISAQIMANIL
jgi:putative transport protein